MSAKTQKIYGQELSAILGLVNNLSNKNDLTNVDNLKHLDINLLSPGRFQPRKKFDDVSIQELADSISAQGILQPLIVKEAGNKYEIIVGERRWRAAQKVGLTHIPAFVCNVNDETALAYALIENIQREELTAIEEAQVFKKLIEEFSLTHDEVGKAVGRSRVYITNLLRLLLLPSDVQNLILEGSLDFGHGRALLSLSPAEQSRYAQTIIEKKLSVRETEKMVKNLLAGKEVKPGIPAEYSEQVTNWQRRLSANFGRVDVKVNSKGQGRAVIFFSSLDELGKLVEKVEK